MPRPTTFASIPAEQEAGLTADEARQLTAALSARALPPAAATGARSGNKTRKPPASRVYQAPHLSSGGDITRGR